MSKQATMGGSTSRARTVPRDRKEPNLSDPRGQLGAFLRQWIDKHHGGDESRLADAVGVSDRAVRKWCEGAAAPDLFKLDALAKAMSYDDWTKLASAVARFVATLG